MPLYVFASAKGAPGTTTALVGVATRWPTTGAVMLAELDPRGGDLAARFQLMPAPGLASAATDPRLSSATHLLAGHAQPLPLGAIPALLSPAQATSAAAAVVALDPRIVAAAGRTSAVLADVGAVQTPAITLPVCQAADLVLMTVRDRVEDLVHAAAAVDLLRNHGVRDLALLVRCTGGLSSAAIGREFGLPVLGELPTDPLGASVLCGHTLAGPGWTRLRLPRACAGLAKTLDRYRPPAGEPATTSVEAAA